jgi:hypothetical protein
LDDQAGGNAAELDHIAQRLRHGFVFRCADWDATGENR